MAVRYGDADMSETAATSDAPAAPGVSVVMPVLNMEDHLAEAVASVLAQDYPGELEVVIAVAPSRDKTADLAQRIAAADSRIVVVPNPRGSIPAGLNAAVKAARHPIVARADGRSRLPRGYLRTAVAEMSRTGADDVGGIMAAEGLTPFQRAVAWAMTSSFGVGAARFHTGGEAGPADSVYLGVYRRAAIERVGGYDETYLRAEDWELNHRIRLAGGLIWFLPGLRVSYRPRESLRALAAQYFQYGRWRRVVARQHEGTINLRYLAPPTAAAAIGAGGSAAWLVPLIAGFAVPACYGTGVLGVAALAARSLPGPVAARLPLVLATMHVSWGIGFLTSSRRLAPGAPRIR